MTLFEVTETRTTTAVYRIEAANEDDALERYERDGEFRDDWIDETLVRAREATS